MFAFFLRRKKTLKTINRIGKHVLLADPLRLGRGVRGVDAKTQLNDSPLFQELGLRKSEVLLGKSRVDWLEEVRGWCRCVFV